MPTHATGFSSAKGFRSVIDIYITGNTLQGVLDSYQKIRKGEGDASWLGEATEIVVSSGEQPMY